ncbi:MAG: FAD-dependent monooxygenase [Candidatus Aenigmarchaeota archaeon]|nr:FAD-dependent monooxygenase [Candidatus Aenigmarchaeota archaeon]
MNDKYDIVIIGAGPAGLKCAEALGNSKLSVLVLEQNDVIGPKICGGGLTALSDSFKIPNNKCLSFKTIKMILNGKEHKITLINPLRTISRFDLGQYQLAIVEKFSNIKIKKSTRIKEIHKNFVLTNKNKKIYFKKLIGADGSTSIVRRFLGLKNKINMGIQYIIPKTHSELVWFMNPKLLKSGYGWIFPHKEYTSAGVYFNPKLISSKNAKITLDKLLNEYGLDYTNAKFEGAPINTLFKGFMFDNIFLVGDAAGLVSASTGEGMSYAMAGGYDIGKCLFDKSCNFEKINEIIKYKKRQELILTIFDKLPFVCTQTLLFKIFIELLKQPKFQKYYGI